MQRTIGLLLQIQTGTAQFVTNLVAVLGFLLFIIATFSIVQFIINRQKRNNLYLEQEALKTSFEKQLLQSQIEVQEATLHTISMELHDNINQLLGSAHNLLNFTKRGFDVVPPTLKEADETIVKASAAIRALSRSLNTEWLQKFDLIENLNAEINRLNGIGQIKYHLSCTDEVNMSNDKQLLLYRIIQEAIQNCMKHAEADNIFISLSNENQQLNIAIADDGNGLDPKTALTGMGTMNMRQRTKLLGGSIDWFALEKGCKVVLVIPQNQ